MSAAATGRSRRGCSCRNARITQASGEANSTPQLLAARCAPIMWRSCSAVVQLHEDVLQARRFGREIVQTPVALDGWRAPSHRSDPARPAAARARSPSAALRAPDTRQRANRFDCGGMAQTHAQRLTAAEPAQRLDGVAVDDGAAMQDLARGRRPLPPPGRMWVDRITLCWSRSSRIRVRISRI